MLDDHLLSYYFAQAFKALSLKTSVNINCKGQGKWELFTYQIFTEFL